MLDDNPYRLTTLLSVSKKSSGGIIVTLWWMIYLHPIIALALIYSCWALTTASLGRPPRFGEHPENAAAHSVMHAMDLPAFLLILGTPILIPIALWRGMARPFAAEPQGENAIRMRVVCLALYIVVLAIAGWIWFRDPFRAIYWFVD